METTTLAHILIILDPKGWFRPERLIAATGSTLAYETDPDDDDGPEGPTTLLGQPAAVTVNGVGLNIHPQPVAISAEGTDGMFQTGKSPLGNGVHVHVFEPDEEEGDTEITIGGETLRGCLDTARLSG